MRPMRRKWRPTGAREVSMNIGRLKGRPEGKYKENRERQARREQSARRRRQATHKRPHGVTLQAEPSSTSTAEPALKKARKGLAAEETVPSGVEEQREEEEDDAPLVRSRGLRSRGPVILEEGKLADEPIATMRPSSSRLP